MKKLRKLEDIAYGFGAVGMIAFMFSMIMYGFGLDTIYNIMTIVWTISFIITAMIFVVSFYLRLCIKRYKQTLAYRKRKEVEVQ